MNAPVQGLQEVKEGGGYPSQRSNRGRIGPILRDGGMMRGVRNYTRVSDGLIVEKVLLHSVVTSFFNKYDKFTRSTIPFVYLKSEIAYTGLL